MNWVSLPVYMMAAVSFYVGFYYLWIFIRRRSDREKLSFAFTCFAIAFYDIFCAGLYNAQNIAEGMFWQRLQFASLALLSITVIWFVFDFAHYRNRKVLFAFAAYFMVLFFLGVFIRNELTLSLDRPLPKHIRLWEIIDVTYHEVDPGIIYLVQYASMMAAYIWILFLIVRDYLKGNRQILPLLVSFIIFFGAAINDVLVGSGSYPFIFLVEYVYMIIILSMAHILLNRFVDLHHEVEELNVGLEKKVEMRTDELKTAMEELEAINDRLVQTNESLEEAQRIAAIDMKMAINVQKNLFPKDMPESDDWDVACTFLPAAGVSGDFYDFYILDRCLAGMSLFDVSGHGVSSGLITLLAKSILYRNVANMRDASPATIMKKVNEELIAELKNVDNYLSGILLMFRGDRVDYVNAGHPDLIMRRAGREPVIMRPRGRELRGGILGINNLDIAFDVLQFPVGKNDVIMIYTDGLSESVNDANKPYGIEGIVGSLKRAGDGPAHEVLDHLLKSFSSYLGTKKPGDDVTVVVAKRNK